ncbi:tetratricopeptide repeat protein [Rhodopirellula sp. P2]|uniref:tetratricopeptide repeat protein n=1 Tax=Rhodopirellula sp. P2 TaxID=2127060 RepID=UPI0023686693|nr:tetratricopeptide repeat protein [Rhodopirellula sp. P2]WDQ17836.1 tetratricopeptide repeat protein [Rhodopirellula sp. P2]
MKTWLILGVIGWSTWWWTPDQLGQRWMQQEQYTEAANAFDDPMWQGVAWYRAGEFAEAAKSFSRTTGPPASFNLGNCWLMQGKYDQAIASYEDALKQRPDWTEAQQNLDLAKARKKATEAKGGDAGDQRLGADEIVFDKDKKKQDEGQDTDITAEQAVNDASVQAVWLRQVQTKPADFLKSKFRYQMANRENDAKDEPAETKPSEGESQ